MNIPEMLLLEPVYSSRVPLKKSQHQSELSPPPEFKNQRDVIAVDVSPMRSPTQSSTQCIDSTAHSSSQQSAAVDENAVPLGTVLFVSDDDYFRSTMRAFLEHADFLVRSCADAARVPELFFGDPGPRSCPEPSVDLLLIDVHTMGATGLLLAVELTAFEPDLPVIVISPPDLEKSALAGIVGRGWKFLSKPVLLPELLELIHGLLAPRKLLQQQNARTCATAVSGTATLDRDAPDEIETPPQIMLAQGRIR